MLRFEPLYIPRLGDLEAGVLQRFDKAIAYHPQEHYLNAREMLICFYLCEKSILDAIFITRS
ncbi:hypothetical protein MEO41_27500 [Dolichospermum sp. ST_sed4]|nr:hypothetical protein [Dolichospermum sp. ST_sed10]MDD1474985.1 hypothetical protein [Dolichospermum sp. ST_sed4]